MFRSFAIATLAAATALLLAPVGLKAQTAVKRINVIVMSDDADQETVPRNNRLFNRVVLALQESLNTSGFQIYDEVGTTLGALPQARVRRTDAELFEVARATQPPMDVAAVFQIYASVRASTVVSRPEVRVAGRLLNVRTGQFIAAFEVGPGITFDPLPQSCTDRECVLERIGDESRRLGADLGRELSVKLAGFAGAPATPAAAAAPAHAAPVAPLPAAVPPALPSESCEGLPTAFMLVLRDFSPEEVTRIEEMASAFRCVEHIRPVRVSSSQADYWIEARSDNARLNRNLRQMLDFIGTRGTVTFSGNRFEVIRTVTR